MLRVSVQDGIVRVASPSFSTRDFLQYLESPVCLFLFHVIPITVLSFILLSRKRVQRSSDISICNTAPLKLSTVFRVEDTSSFRLR
jgi:hypothetical protein